ncbi:putative acetyltransferase [Trifolium repens]|nr:putative acetyltransferase [Trifolium repens]
MSSSAVQHVSECFIKPLFPIQESKQICYLTTWDIAMLSMHYIQKGLLFKKPPTPNNHQDFIHNLLENLKQSISLALFHLYPLSGRLVTQKTQEPPSYSVFVDCSNDNPGARFIYGTLDATIYDILSPVDHPPVVDSLFDLDRAINHDGHTMPLLSIQVTELVDGVFVGCSMNHCIGDGTSFWNFFNVWSEIFQAREKGRDVVMSRQPFHNRWFLEGCGPLINLPFKHHDEFTSRFEAPKLRERFFHFSAESIAKLKAKANEEANTNEISSFQSLSAFLWRSVTRARGLAHDQKVSCKFAINNRPRIKPPLLQEYFGNSVDVVSTETTVGKLLENDLGWAAWKVHTLVVNHDDREAREIIGKWLESPIVYQLGRHFDPFSVVMSSSPRFNMYGNEFGMGKAVAVLSGYANKFNGNVTAYEGYEGGGSMVLAVSLLPDAMRALELDDDFMNVVSVANFDKASLK